MNAAEGLLSEAEQALRGRRLDQALASFKRVEGRGAEGDRCAAGRWMVHMLRGDFLQAWTESDAIRERGSFDPHRMWQGEPLAGKRVMLRCLHGFGDAVQFLRYMPRLRKIAAGVIVQVAPRFVELAACFDGVDQVITWGQDALVKEPDWDVQIEVMELPYIFRTQAGDLPIATRYLSLTERSSGLGASRGDCLQVGLVWTAGEWNTERCVPPSLLKPLLDLSGCEFWNLQRGECSFEHEALLEDESCRDSIAGLAARIARLDLVITVDALAAHLAGALGVPAWVMLQHEADWRWMDEREDSPWYPSLRLFRQSQAGDWHGVISAVSEALQRLTRECSEQGMVA